MKLRLKNLLINLRINSSGYHSNKGRTRLDGVELEKCGGELEGANSIGGESGGYHFWKQQMVPVCVNPHSFQRKLKFGQPGRMLSSEPNEELSISPLFWSKENGWFSFLRC